MSENIKKSEIKENEKLIDQRLNKCKDQSYHVANYHLVNFS